MRLQLWQSQIQSLAALLVVQLPANAPREAVEDSSIARAPATLVGDSDEAPGFSLAQLWVCSI